MMNQATPTIDDLLNRGTVDVVVADDLRKKLESGKKLRIKLGIDPTKPDLHLGHMVPLRKLRQWQDAGHQIILLFGGFTATIGDPTGKNDARPPLTMDEVEANAAEYLRQAGKVLDLEKIELVNNRDWFKDMKPERFLELMAQFTVAQMMERDMFQERKKNGQAVYCHEILYPMLQGYDSVEIRADVEIGGTDQLFNLLAARPLQKAAGQAPQNVMTVPLLEGLDGVQKMSKSLGNYVGMDDAPWDMFGKLMSVPDALMEKYFELLTNENLTEIKALIETNPRDAKVHLGRVIVRDLHGEDAAEKAYQDFVTKFVKKDVPDDIPEIVISTATTDGITLVFAHCGFAKSGSEARRLIQGGGVSLNGEKLTDPKAPLELKTGDTLKVGKKKYAKLRISR